MWTSHQKMSREWTSGARDSSIHWSRRTTIPSCTEAVFHLRGPDEYQYYCDKGPASLSHFPQTGLTRFFAADRTLCHRQTDCFPVNTDERDERMRGEQEEYNRRKRRTRGRVSKAFLAHTIAEPGRQGIQISSRPCERLQTCFVCHKFVAIKYFPIYEKIHENHSQSLKNCLALCAPPPPESAQ
jgi:hypothetical protein